MEDTSQTQPTPQANPNEPTILVKKADGTTERVPLSQLKRGGAMHQAAGSLNGEAKQMDKPADQSAAQDPNMKQGSAARPASESQKKESVGKSSIRKPNKLEPVNIEKRAAPKSFVSRTLPEGGTKEVSKHSDIQETAKQKDAAKTDPVRSIQKEDITSPLEEDISEVAQHSLPSTPQGRSGLLGTIASKVDFPIPDELRGRVESLAESRIKEIRTDDQVKEYAMRPTNQGGLGFTEDQAEALVVAIAHPGVMQTPPSRPAPMIADPQSLKPSAPAQSLPTTPAPVSVAPKATFSKPMNQGPSMHDVAPPQEAHTAVGPIEEVGMMTLDDFRRLAPDNQDRVEILKRKFSTMMGESYTEYLKARDAWFRSPIYMQYQEIVKEALNTKEAIPAVVASKGTLSMDEFLAVSGVGRYIEL